MKLKRIIIPLIIAVMASIAAFAVTPPEIIGTSTIRTEDPMGFRVAASIDMQTAMDENTSEYGFLITRKVFLSGNGLSNEDLRLDCHAYYTKGVSKGVVDGEEVDIFFEKNDTEVIFTGHFFGIQPYYYTDIIVARPYVISSGEGYYGTPVELCLYDMAKQVKNNTVLYESLTQEQKSVIDYIIFCIDGEAYTLNPDDYRIVLSCTKVKNDNPTYSVSYDLYNPVTGEIYYRVKGRKRTKDMNEISSMLLKAGAVVPMYDGLVQDTTDGYVIAELSGDNALWVKDISLEAETITFVPADASLKCKDCINEYMSNNLSGFTDIYGTAHSSNTAKLDAETPIRLISGTKDGLFEAGAFTTSDITAVAENSTSVRGYNFADGERVYSDYIKTLACVDERGVCKYLIVLVCSDDNAALDEKCLMHTYYDVTFIVDGEEYDLQSVNHGDCAKLPEAPEKVGYDFLGWSNGTDIVSPETLVVTKDTSYNAVFQIQTFEVRYIVDGEEYEVFTVDYNTTPELPATPEKVGYDFLGWSNAAGDIVSPETVAVTEETSYYAVFQIQAFEVKYIVDGEEYEVFTVDYNTTPELPATPEKVGYDFIGWSDGTDIVSPETVAVTEETSYYAVFKLQTFEVKYIVDGEAYKTFTVDYNTTPELPATPEKVGYDFLGWAESENGETINPEEIEVTEAKTYYAVFQIQAFEVKYIVDGEEYEVFTVDYNTTPELPATPEKVGYDFLGWSNGTDIVSPETLAVTEETSYYAVFQIQAFEVKYIVDGEEYKVFTVDYNTTPELPATPEKVGYDFIGWSNGTDIVSPETVAVTKETSYYAVFKLQTFEVKYIVDGEEYEVFTVDYNTTPELPVTPEKVGYDFLGWSNGTDIVSPETVAVTKDTSYNAVFKIQTFEVRYIVDGEEYKVFTVNYNTTPELPATPEKVGYDFLGWSNGTDIVSPETLAVTKETSYYSVFQIKTFEVKYIVDGEEYKVFAVDYNTTPSLPATPEKVGYDFLGWSDTVGGAVVNMEQESVTEDACYYAIFEVKTLTVLFYTKDTLYDEQTIVWGGSPKLPKEPSIHGNIFHGWTNTAAGTTEDVITVTDIVVTEDMTFYAVLEALQNDPNLIEILTRGKDQLVNKVRATNEKHKQAIALIVECITYILEDANNGIYIDKQYIYDTYPEIAKSLKNVIKVDMTESERSQFTNLLTNKRYVDKDVQDFLIDYFDIDMSKI